MKITTLLVLKSLGDSASTSGVGEQQQQAVMLANASNVSHFCYFQRPAALEFILFAALEFILCAPWLVSMLTAWWIKEVFFSLLLYVQTCIGERGTDLRWFARTYEHDGCGSRLVVNRADHVA
jgi:hypothetical protein